MQTTKQKIVSGVIGAIILATAFLGYTFYKEISLVAQDHSAVVQIVGLINKSQSQTSVTK